ncbi:MAG: hypothetical protein LC115_10425 [Bacteroidia bacterium]|nr:hypothetical protein [Bacteroidia bacterium]
MRITQSLFKLLFFTLLISLFLIKGSFHSNAQRNWSPVEENEIPNKILQKMKEIYTNPSSIRWGMRYKGRELIYHASGMNDGSTFSVTFDGQGEVIGSVQKVGQAQVPESILKDSKQIESQGWKTQEVYRNQLQKKGSTYRVFFYNESGDLMKKTYDSTGKEKETKTVKKKKGDKGIQPSH